MNPRSREVERRRRLLTRALPLILIALVAFVIGAIAGKSGSPEQEAAERFVKAWEGDEFATMYKELNPASRREIELNDFAGTYRAAEEIATLRSLEADSPEDASSRDGKIVVAVPIQASTV
ncbi:MAG TPA: NTF2-like N-terminal transpeptidase domain-containing protein, partial [Solirubrobacterales bacterium]|nr:NTF2-like N-terminal transpeptidase domain-containing protein [Solirubrobacterales bacterium]